MLTIDMINIITSYIRLQSYFSQFEYIFYVEFTSKEARQSTRKVIVWFNGEMLFDNAIITLIEDRNIKNQAICVITTLFFQFRPMNK